MRTSFLLHALSLKSDVGLINIHRTPLVWGPGLLLALGGMPGSSARAVVQGVPSLWWKSGLHSFAKQTAQPSELSPTDKYHRGRMQTRQRTIGAELAKCLWRFPLSSGLVRPSLSGLRCRYFIGMGGEATSAHLVLCVPLLPGWGQKKKPFLMVSVNASPENGSRAGLVQFPSFRETEALGRKAAPFRAPCSQALTRPVM